MTVQMLDAGTAEVGPTGWEAALRPVGRHPVPGPTVPTASGGRVIGARARDGVGCPPATRREGYRLGRWERCAMTIVVTGALVVAALTLVRPTALATRTVTVLPGDTMTSLVLREVPGVDVTRAAEWIETFNDLAGPTVTAGMRLVVPAER